MKKIGFLLFSLILLSSCVQLTAMIGPAITGVTSGNIYQTGLSYGINKSIEEKTGKSFVKLISTYAEQKEKKIERQKDIISLVKKHVQTVRKKTLTKN